MGCEGIDFIGFLGGCGMGCAINFEKRFGEVGNVVIFAPRLRKRVVGERVVKVLCSGGLELIGSVGVIDVEAIDDVGKARQKKLQKRVKKIW
jgi:hypothetical protein